MLLLIQLDSVQISIQSVFVQYLLEMAHILKGSWLTTFQSVLCFSAGSSKTKKQKRVRLLSCAVSCLNLELQLSGRREQFCLDRVTNMRWSRMDVSYSYRSKTSQVRTVGPTGVVLMALRQGPVLLWKVWTKIIACLYIFYLMLRILMSINEWKYSVALYKRNSFHTFIKYKHFYA